MIFVAVGTQKFQFNRLLITLDDLISSGVIKEEVFGQIGNSDYIPRNYSYTNFLNKDEFDDYINKSDLVITHSGVATIIAGLKSNTPTIVVPRLQKFGEHVDDHQVQISENFSKQNLVIICNESDNLAALIEKAKTHRFSKYLSQRELMIKTIRDYLN